MRTSARVKIDKRLARAKAEVEREKEAKQTVVAKNETSEENNDVEKLCYNCLQTGHWFMDCMGGCGRCGGKGHRTVDCGILDG